MRDPTALLLTFTNVLMGALVVGALLYVLLGPFRERLSRLKKLRAYEAELDHDLEEMFAGFSRVAVEVRPERAGVLQSIRMRFRRAWRRIAGAR